MIGDRISYFRRVKGLKQIELAELIGVAPQAISSWERNTSRPNPLRYSKIAEALGVSISDLDSDLQKQVDSSKENILAYPGDVASEYSALIAILHFRRKHPDLCKLLLTGQLTDDMIRIIAGMPKAMIPPDTNNTAPNGGLQPRNRQIKTPQS